MARIRTVKPSLFRHELLFEAEQETGLPIRLAFVGLFTCCDREGKFVWHPRELKLDCLPYDDVDFSRVLDALWTRGFLVKYEEKGTTYGQIPTFNKHQVINNREKASELPNPCEQTIIDASSTRASHVNEVRKGNMEGNMEYGREEERESSLRSDVCAEPQAAHAPAAKPPSAPDLFQKPVFISIPTNRFATIGEEVGITEAKVAEWEQTYPAVDVRQQLRQIRQWSIDKPIKRKTMKGMMPFVSNWLAREQNKGGNRTYDNGRNGSYANGHKQNAHDAFILGAAIAGGVVAGGPTCTPQPGDDANVALEFGQPRSRAA